MPRHVQIQTTSICNARCRCCPYATTQQHRPMAIMDPPTWRAVLDALSGRQWGRICLYLQAEPLVDHMLERRIEDVRERLAFESLEIATNCELLTPSRADSLLATIWDTPMTWGLSFQGVDRESFEDMTGLGWDTCLANLSAFLQRTDGNGQRRVIRSVGRPGASAFWLERFAELGIQHAVEVHGDPGISRAGNVQGGRRTVLHPEPDFVPRCSRLTDWLHITVDGKVIPCCHDYRREAILGDVVGQELHEILVNIVPTMHMLASRRGFLCRYCEQARPLIQPSGPKLQ